MLGSKAARMRGRAGPGGWRTPTALAVLVAALALAACGDEGAESTTTLTAHSTPPATTAGAPTVPGTASSDAAAAIPGEQSAVAGETTEAGTVAPATTTATAVTEGEPVNDGAVQIDPATGLPVATTSTTPTTDAGGTALPPTATTIPAPTAPTSASSSSASTEGILQRPFSATSPWNTQIAGDPVDPESKNLMQAAAIRLATVERNGRTVQKKRRIKVGLTTNVTRWTVPVFSDNQPGAVERIAVCRQLDCGPDAISTLTVPPDACPDPQYDGWMTALDTNARVAYDLWRARCEMDGSLSYHYVKRWELDGPGFQQPTGVSARGSGLPLFAGLITPDEVKAGRIEHALAISVPGAATRRYVQPASRTDGVGTLGSLPEGARLRLSSGASNRLTRTFVRNGTQRQTAMTIIDALQRYGAIVVDRSAAPTMYAQRNYDWTGLLPLNLLQDIPLKEFEVMELDEIRFDPPKAGEEPAALPLGTPSSIPGTASGSQGATAYGSPDTDFGQDVTP